MRQAARIDVGMLEGRAGFTIEYTDGERAHFLFGLDVAKDLAEKLLHVVRDLEYLQRQTAGLPSDPIGIREGIALSLTPPSTPSGGDTIGITGGD